MALSSRYGVNTNSYESELTVGGEWWIGSGRGIGGWRGLREGDKEVQAADGFEGEMKRDGVLKGRISGDGVVSLVYEARMRMCLVSCGVVSDLGSRSRPIRGIGLEIHYMSEDERGA
jgi:distribution and morphology protein 10